jgi:putative ABC transport system permease protein
VVSENFFDLLGVRPAAGRGFTAGDEDVVVLGHSLAERLFTGDVDAALGETIRLGDVRYSVIGVAPPSFKGIGAMGVVSELWLPMAVLQRVSAFGHLKETRSARIFAAVGRLEDGVARESAARDFDRLATRLRLEFPDDNPGLGLAVRPLDESIIDPNQRDRFLLGGKLVAGLAALLILMACFNASNLLLIDAIRRRGEIAIRLSLGAGTPHLVRQLVLEGAVLALAGGLLGFGVATAVQRFLWAQRPSYFAEDYLNVAASPRVLGFAIAAALVAGVLASAVPVLELRRPDLVSRLRLGGLSTTSRSHKLGLRNQLVALQVALAVVSLTAAALFVRNLDRALEIDLGMATDRLLLLQYDLPSGQYGEERGLELGRRAVERVTALPGIERAALAGYPPLTPFAARQTLVVEGEPAPEEGQPLVQVNPVGVGYFETVGLPIVRGRAFSEFDRSDGTAVAVVNRTMAERFWPGEDVLDRVFRLGSQGVETRVVGVAADSKYARLGEEPEPYVYVPVTQAYRSRMTLHARTRGDPELLIETFRREVQELDPDLPLTAVETLRTRIRESLWAARLAAAVATLVGIVCLLLASAGIYGVIDFSVRERKRELGIRMALGGRAERVVWRVVAENMVVVAAGMVLGTALAAYLLRLTGALLFGLGPADGPSWLGAIFLLGVVALGASYLPARRAARIDPVSALRER